jgi:pyrimidine operon attenuation protein/uracil phosphoribosyltransferase
VKVLADAADTARMIRRLAHEIVEKNRGIEGVVLVGIRTGGLTVAQRLRAEIEKAEGKAPALGAVDIAFYRDDVAIRRARPEVGPTELPASIDGLKIVLVDDVLYTGRTVRAALDALMDYGRPRAVQLAVLVDRGQRELPIGADYVGMAVETTPDQLVRVADDQIVIRSRP